MARFTVPSTGTFTNSRDGHRYYFRQGDLIDLALAVECGMSGASLPADPAPFSDAQIAYLNTHGAGASTIHNWFPDPTITDATKIDTDNSYPSGKHFYTDNGVEVLSQATWNGETWLKCALDGSGWGDGVTISIPGVTFPPGRYRFASLVGVESPSYPFVLRTRINPLDGAGGNPHYRTQNVSVFDNFWIMRVVCEVYNEVECAFQLEQTIWAYDNAARTNAPTGNLYIKDIMVTEGDPYLFRDGDSDGWTWAGTANASASSGPQP